MALGSSPHHGPEMSPWNVDKPREDAVSEMGRIEGQFKRGLVAEKKDDEGYIKIRQAPHMKGSSFISGPTGEGFKTIENIVDTDLNPEEAAIMTEQGELPEPLDSERLGPDIPAADERRMLEKMRENGQEGPAVVKRAAITKGIGRTMGELSWDGGSRKVRRTDEKRGKEKRK